MTLFTTKFIVPKMDCPSEEILVKMALEKSNDIESFTFELSNRSLTVVHRGKPEDLLHLLTPLNFGATIADTKIAEAGEMNATPSSADESKVLIKLFVLNLGMFFVEVIAGIFSQSTSLIADGLDMLADASVYGISLFAVGKAIVYKKFAARISGYLQLLLATGILVEVLRRFFSGSEPIGFVISSVAILALCVNILCLVLLARHRNGEVHMKASWIFSANDVLANLGVIFGGILVVWTGSNYPDLIIGSIISLIVFSGAIRILRMS